MKTDLLTIQRKRYPEFFLSPALRELVVRMAGFNFLHKFGCDGTVVC